MSTNHTYHEAPLLQRIAAGDESAMKELYNLCYGRMYYFAFKLTGNEGEARDLVQEAFLVFWQRRQQFRDSATEGAEAFLITTIRNRAYNYLKRRQMKAGKEAGISREMPLSEDYLETQVIRADVFHLIYKEMQTLPPGQVELLKMIFLEDLDTNEIAERLQTTPNNVRNQKARALEKLRTLLLKKGLYTLFLLVFPELL